jgi:hypothetical protein
MSDLSEVGADFGYRFEPPGAADQPIYRKLSAIIRTATTEERFDPDKLECRVAGAHGEVDNLVVFHPWPFLNEYRLVAGRLAIVGRHDKKVSAFTFGGSLRIDSKPDQTTGVFESPVPILALLPENPFLARLAAQAEGLLARRQAEWDSKGQLDQFEARLAAADPQALYQACLTALSQALPSGSQPLGPQDKHLEHFIAAESQPGGTALENLL